jgi:putative ABC transport system permease protein
MIIKAITSHYRRQPLQLLALALMIVVATMLWTGVSELTGQARESLAVSEQAVAAREAVVRVDGQPVTVADFVILRREGVCVAPWLETSRKDPARRVIGIDPLAMACFDAPPAGGTAQGNVAELDGRPFVDISAVAGQSAQPGQLSLLVSPDTGALPEGYQRRVFQLGPATGELADSFLLNLDALSLLVLLITGLLVRSVYHLGLAQRRSSFALLNRFGITGARIHRLLAAELIVLTLICVVPGVLLGQALASRLGQGFGQALGSLFDLSLYAASDSPVPWQAALVMVVLVLAVCLVDRLIPLLILLLKPQRPAAAGKSSSVAVFPGWLWILMLASGMAMVLWAMSLIWVFVGIALVFGGAGGLMPAILARWADAMAGRQVQSPDSPLGRWRYRELAVMFRRLALPVVALQFAMATVLAVQALVTTFEDTFEQWLAQRLSAELYVEVPEEASAEAGARALAQMDGLGTWHRVQRGKAEVLQTGSGAVAADLMVLLPLTPLVTDWVLIDSVAGPWEALSTGGVMVNEQLSRRQGVVPGQRLRFAIAGETLEADVVAIYADYGRPSAELLLHRDSLPDSFTPGFQSFSVNPGDYTVAEIARRLRTEWQVADLIIRDNASIQALASQVFQQTFVLTRAISVLTLVLASVSLLVMGWVFFSARSWYFQLLGLWGVPPETIRGQLRRLALLLTLGVTVVALPLGVWLTWALVSRINPLAFGWSLPMAVYPGFWLELSAVMGAIGLVIAWLIGRQLAGQESLRPGGSLAGGGER